MSRIDARLERALLAVAVATTAVLLLAVPDGEPIVSGDTITIAVAAGVAVYASKSEGCGSCGCCNT